MVEVVDDVVIVDGGCADVGGDVADSGGDDDGLGVSSWGAVCVTVLAVEVGIICAIADCHCQSSFACVAISQVLVLVWGLGLLMLTVVLVLSRSSLAFIALLNPSFVTRYPSSRPKFIPFSNPSSIPNLIPSSIPSFLPCFIPNFSPSSNARIQSSQRFLPSWVEAGMLQNWAMHLRSAISRKVQKSQAVVDSDAILMLPFLGDTTAVSAVAVFLFEDFF